MSDKYLKISAALFLLPFLFFIRSVVENNDYNFQDVIFVLSYITVIPLGAPIFMLLAVYLVFRNNLRGAYLLRFFSGVLLFLFVGMILLSNFIPDEVVCSETGSCPEPTTTNLALRFVFILIYPYS